MDTSVRYTPKMYKIRNPKFVFGQHQGADKKKSSQGDSQY